MIKECPKQFINLYNNDNKVRLFIYVIIDKANEQRNKRNSIE